MFGGGGRNRTGVDGFAGRCITTLLPRRGSRIVPVNAGSRYQTSQPDHRVPQDFTNEKGKLCGLPFLNLEREKSLELSTSTLARLRSTN